MKTLVWLLPYLIASCIYMSMWIYCRLCRKHFLARWKAVTGLLQQDLNNKEALAEKEEILGRYATFPDCLLQYHLFTFPLEPIELTPKTKQDESS